MDSKMAALAKASITDLAHFGFKLAKIAKSYKQRFKGSLVKTVKRLLALSLKSLPIFDG
jgi:hypothetical protein